MKIFPFVSGILIALATMYLCVFILSDLMDAIIKDPEIADDVRLYLAEGILNINFMAWAGLVAAILAGFGVAAFSSLKNSLHGSVMNDIRTADAKGSVFESMDYYEQFEEIKDSHRIKNESGMALLMDAIVQGKVAINFINSITDEEQARQKTRMLALASTNLAYFYFELAEYLSEKGSSFMGNQDNKDFHRLIKAKAIAVLDEHVSEIETMVKSRVSDDNGCWYEISESNLFVRYHCDINITDKAKAKKAYSDLLDDINAPSQWKEEMRKGWIELPTP